MMTENIFTSDGQPRIPKQLYILKVKSEKNRIHKKYYFLYKIIISGKANTTVFVGPFSLLRYVV
jgi:hypothetical protein